MLNALPVEAAKVEPVSNDPDRKVTTHTFVLAIYYSLLHVPVIRLTVFR